jgi:hypothetical protein
METALTVYLRFFFFVLDWSVISLSRWHALLSGCCLPDRQPINVFFLFEFV